MKPYSLYKKRYNIIWNGIKKEDAIFFLTQYFEEFGDAESIAQDDNAQLEASEVLGIIADILKWKEGIVPIND